MKYIYSDTLTNYHGPEQKAELKRVKPKLRKGNRLLVTKRYETHLHTYVEQKGLLGKVLNMYDYFQKAIEIPVVDLHVRLSDMFDKSIYKIKGIDNNQSDIYINDSKVAEVRIAPLTVQLIGEVIWLNVAGDPVSKDIYDRRGFLSSTQYYHLDGQMGHQVIYDVTGKPVIEVSNMAIDGVNHVTSYKLLDYQGANYLFVNEDELWEFFKQELESVEVSK